MIKPVLACQLPKFHSVFDTAKFCVKSSLPSDPQQYMCMEQKELLDFEQAFWAEWGSNGPIPSFSHCQYHFQGAAKLRRGEIHEQ